MKFDYYIFIDYSENLIGYNIIEKESVKELIKEAIKLRHFKKLKHKRTYLLKVKKIFKKGRINSLIYKQKIYFVRDTLLAFNEIVEFVKKNQDKKIFISIDNKQYT